MAVPGGQLEAGAAYGMSPAQVIVRILLPQMVRHAIPGFGNNWLVLTKATALVSIIGLDDMVRKASLASGATRMPFTFYSVVAINYLIITTVSIYLLQWLENRYSLGVEKTDMKFSIIAENIDIYLKGFWSHLNLSVCHCSLASLSLLSSQLL